MDSVNSMRSFIAPYSLPPKKRKRKAPGKKVFSQLEKMTILIKKGTTAFLASRDAVSFMTTCLEFFRLIRNDNVLWQRQIQADFTIPTQLKNGQKDFYRIYNRICSRPIEKSIVSKNIFTVYNAHSVPLAADPMKTFTVIASGFNAIVVKKEGGPLKAHCAIITAVAVGTKLIVTGDQLGCLRIWQQENGEWIFREIKLKKSNWIVSTHKLCMDPNERWIAASTLEMPTLCLVTPTHPTGSFMGTCSIDYLDGHTNLINAILPHPEGPIFTGSADGSLHIWQRGTTGKFQTGKILSFKGEILSMALTPDGSCLAIGSLSGLLIARKNPGYLNWVEVANLSDQTTYALAFSPTSVLVSSSEEGLSLYYDRGSDRWVQRACLELEAHVGEIALASNGIFTGDRNTLLPPKCRLWAFSDSVYFYNLDSLPTRFIKKIGSFLDVSDLARLSCVSQLFSASVIRDCWIQGLLR